MILRDGQAGVAPVSVDSFRLGDPEKQEDFEILRAYSPLHNLEKGVRYPATLVTTADHDDRVVPAHSFKFAATLQDAQDRNTPALIRIETSAGHGAASPTSKRIAMEADRLAFLVKVTEINQRPSERARPVDRAWRNRT